MNNEISYVAPKKKMMIHSMILISRISCVFGIPISGFKKERQAVFGLMEINVSPALKTFLQSKIIKSKKTRVTITDKKIQA